MWYSSPSNADEWVNVGLSGELNGVRPHCRGSSVDNNWDGGQGRVPWRRKVEALEETEGGGHGS